MTWQRRVKTWAKEIAIVLAAAMVLSLIIKTFFFQSFWIPSASMEGTLVEGDRILVSKWRPGPFDLRRGDIVVFKDPGGWITTPPPDSTNLPGPIEDVLTFTGLLPADAGEHLVKRVIALPGEHIECCDADGYLLINGERLVEPYLASGIEPSSFEFSATVPEGYVWVMGDNRPNSQDSRAHLGDPGGGAIPIDNVVGTAFAVVWPFSHWDGLGNPYEN